MIMIGDIILMVLGFSEAAENPTMIENLIGLFMDIVPIIFLMKSLSVEDS